MSIRIDDELIDHLLFLSRLSVDNKEKLKNDLQEIVDYFEVLSEVDTEGLEPMYTPIEESAALREDRPQQFDNVEGILNNFPEKVGKLVKVPGIYG
ncbi:MAG TPA: Asp-tRNA(Asn)/Glu-tRNA(Gln) amidotransferase subunit GatC [Fervidobacterium sp.]|nr:Asp-tRNA(Asn)/Glu-tRNA(Gln) amidotransferase subunit GatC [Fervidobacterium sp.]HOM74001.1 Asp-tRNA(Asn)/Glu-tRNA(Gln) amidotransferase subunit GatC [Fervidobacterium sp.]HPP17665.1 Asp-tRNA(Asn)/Glu-tRNA(Gln) amidotransferase subunit GatC [Fervidobacterium sp.]HPZ17285.1 Asp-tRNA(Asn)/Glu-tRNA(Gln) amidotransferase subunit GatC [Fervidobacterium sp.]HQE48109.1 Asp-tRNA(Asn)/Glu-tRNA(Gln) amidotransferase subunit GatC [Fervidobacterium sp.]